MNSYSGIPMPLVWEDRPGICFWSRPKNSFGLPLFKSDRRTDAQHRTPAIIAPVGGPVALALDIHDGIRILLGRFYF
jgi:hypothetical protein